MNEKRSNLPKIVIGLVIVAGIIWGIMTYRLAQVSPGQVHLESAIKLIQENQAVPAVKELEEAVKLDPKLVQGWQMLGDIYLEGQRFASALTALEHVKGWVAHGPG